ncbi:MAG: ImmA/IrrE family metallo-endopeptidase [Pirellulales bacterium]
MSEEIIEFELGMDIVPTPGLHQFLEVDGFITSDLCEIWVDQFVYASRPGRYRFTLAHEVGHSILHTDIFQSQVFHSVADWKAFVNSIPDKEHGWLEYQAYAFAGLVLVPREQLETATRKCVDMIRSEGIDLKENWDFAWSRIAAFLSKQFEVSSAVIEKRLEKDRLSENWQ